MWCFDRWNVSEEKFCCAIVISFFRFDESETTYDIWGEVKEKRHSSTASLGVLLDGLNHELMHLTSHHHQRSSDEHMPHRVAAADLGIMWEVFGDLASRRERDTDRRTLISLV